MSETSAPQRLPSPPVFHSLCCFLAGAHDRTRTGDPVLTKNVLYQLSYAGDTRVLSTYRFSINGHAWELLGRSQYGHGEAHWEFQNPLVRDPLTAPQAATHAASRRNGSDQLAV